MAKDGVPEWLETKDTEVMETGGIVVDIIEDVPTRKIIVGRFAFNDKCACGASCTIAEDDGSSLVIYDSQTFVLLACPVCLPADELIPLYKRPTRPTLHIVKET